MIKHKLRQICFIAGCLSFFVISPSYAEDINSSPTISIIIDDIGYRIHEDTSAIALPGPVAYAIMPHSPHAVTMSRLASQQGKIVLLHLPMEAEHKEQNQFLGPGALTLNMNREQFNHTLNMNLRSIPDAIGVNNHMGSLLTRYPGHMEWLMESLSSKRIFYIDSVTSEQSVTRQIAMEKKVPYLRRDVFLDNYRNKHYIQQQFDELIKVAKRKGRAIAIGHPHTETIEVLTKNLQQLEKYGVQLVSLKELVIEQNRNMYTRQTLLSH